MRSGAASDLLVSAHAVVEVTPGTEAAMLGKAEDAPHASGDTGVMLLAVRKDTAIDAYNYTLDGSTYASGYDADSGRAAGGGQISRCFWAIGEAAANSNGRSFRNDLGPLAAWERPRRKVCA